VTEGRGRGAREAPPDGASPLIGADRDQLVGQLVGGLAHDFNNMLATVLGCLELMERRLADPDRLRALITRATSAVERAAGLNTALVQFSRREPEAPRAAPLADSVQRVMPLIASALGRRAQLVVDLPDSSPSIEADPGVLDAAVIALCLAARRALPEGGEVRLTAAGAPPALIVTAEGPGTRPTDLTFARRLAARLPANIAAAQPSGAAAWRITLQLA